MSAQIIDGRALAAQLRKEIKNKIDARLAQGLPRPSLVVIQVGKDPASSVYVRNKHQACEEVGIRSIVQTLPENTTEEDLVQFIKKYNEDASIHGILVQLPLPAPINTDNILEQLDPRKDVDGFHPFNLGRLAQRRPLLRPCTPYGVVKMLEHIQFPFKKSNVTLVGVSNIVGRPMGLELLLAGSTVTLCHRFTPDLPANLKTADCVIVAIGKPRFIQGAWLKPGCVVIDVGITRMSDGTLAGDVDFESAKEVASWISPVPGGVGPMTVATLLENTLYAAEL